jgi:hypothetical protein
MPEKYEEKIDTGTPGPVAKDMRAAVVTPGGVRRRYRDRWEEMVAKMDTMIWPDQRKLWGEEPSVIDSPIDFVSVKLR